MTDQTNGFDPLRLDCQLCFPLYVCAKEIVRKYKPHLDGIDLTYTQYLAMMVLWERRTVNVRDLGRILTLDSGTLTPLLKKLEQKGYLVRARDKQDERCLDVSLTEKGEKLKDRAACIPGKVAPCLGLSPEEAKTLHSLLHRILAHLPETEEG
ncbi:MAG: MarR family transcriptional regulator [Clostridia bacterium]|nr:MarR family transcriptional regulator [Clostridia bacterium]